MNRATRHRTLLTFSLFLVPFSFALCGCGQKDADRLAALGAKLGRKAGGMLAPGGGRIMRGWQAVPLHIGDLAVDARVSARLGWDKSLADASIEVTAVGYVVELRGKVRDEEQKRRAVELAQTTLGVEKVADLLEIGERQ
jgi:hypothetical protein